MRSADAGKALRRAPDTRYASYCHYKSLVLAEEGCPDDAKKGKLSAGSLVQVETCDAM